MHSKTSFPIHSAQTPRQAVRNRLAPRVVSPGPLGRVVRFFRLSALALRRLAYVQLWGMDIAPSASFSLKAKLDFSHPKGIHIGPDSYIAFEAVILTHDMTRGIRADTRIGARCFIGARSIILPGVTIGDGSVVGAGSVVTRDVPPRCLVAGNPAVILRQDIQTFRYGCLIDYEGGQLDPPPNSNHPPS